MSFRGINTTVIQIRRQVFTEVARMGHIIAVWDILMKYI